MIKKKIQINISEISFESIEPDQPILILWKRGHKFRNQGAITSLLFTKNIVNIDMQCTLFENGFDSKIKSKYIEFYTFKLLDNQYIPWIKYQFDLSKISLDGHPIYLSQSDAKGTKITIVFMGIYDTDNFKTAISSETTIPSLNEPIVITPEEIDKETPCLEEVEKKVETGDQILKMKLL